MRRLSKENEWKEGVSGQSSARFTRVICQTERDVCTSKAVLNKRNGRCGQGNPRLMNKMPSEQRKCLVCWRDV